MAKKDKPSVIVMKELAKEEKKKSKPILGSVEPTLKEKRAIKGYKVMDRELMAVAIATGKSYKEVNDLSLSKARSELSQNKNAKIVIHSDPKLRERILDLNKNLQEAILQATYRKIEDASLVQSAIAYGILADKYRLETGQSTANIMAAKLEWGTPENVKPAENNQVNGST